MVCPHGYALIRGGGENVLIGQYMVHHRGSDRNSIIMGRSVHNQQIKRLWRDLFSGCISYFYYLFYGFENDGLLDPDNPLDIHALHIVFLPKLQHQHNQFHSGWANHRMRTEHNKSPICLWIEGMRNLQMQRIGTLNLLASKKPRLRCQPVGIRQPIQDM